MVKSLHQQIGFSAGELSPKIDARVDSPKYAAGLRQCLNMIPYKMGPLTRAPGTQYIANTKKVNTPGHNYAVRTLPFTFSPTTSFVLEFGDHYIRFYSNGQQVMVNSAPTWVSGQYYYPGNYVTDPTDNKIYLRLTSGSGSVQPHLDTIDYVQQTILEIPNTPYGADALTGSIYTTDIYKLAFTQINDVIYLVSPDYRPYSLTRISDTDWSFGAVVYKTPALLDQNATDTIITPSAVQGLGVTLTASAPAWVSGNFYNLDNSVEVSGVIYNCIVANVAVAVFATDLSAGYWEPQTIFRTSMVEGVWQLATLRNSSYIEVDGTAAAGFSNTTSDPIQCLGAWEVHTYGVWSADIAIQRSTDSGVTWNTVRTLTGRNDRNADIEGRALSLSLFRLVVSNVSVPTTPGPTDPRVVFECVDTFIYGLVELTGVISPTVAVGNVTAQLADSNPLASPWVSGQAYTAGDFVSYNFVNYTCLINIMSATPPSQDATNWGLTAPGGTLFWSEAAWSDYRGFPRAITSFQQRIVYGGSGYEPQRIWGTVTNDLENFARGDQTLATDSFAFDLNAPSRGPIYWLIGQTDLFAGFSGAEWVINSGSTNQLNGGAGAAITATSINAVEHSSWGSAPFVSPAIIGNALFFTQRQATSQRQMMFSVYTEKYMSQDLTLLSDHLFASGIVALAYQPRWHKQSLIWALTEQGTLCAMTYELDQEIFGWAPRQTGYGQTDPDDIAIPPDNGFESVCVIDGQGKDDDEVWVVANRLIGGVQTRFIERVNPNNWEEFFVGAPNPPMPVLADAFYVDCGLTVTNPGTTTIPGLSYLEGRYVYGLADGNAFGPILVTGGMAQLPAAIPATVAKVQIGLPISYAGQPMRIDNDPSRGNTQGLVKQISDVFIRVWNSMGGSIANGTDGLGINQSVPIAYPLSTGPFGVPTFISVPTDIRVIPKPNPTPGNDPIYIVQGNDALPLTVLCLVLKYDVTASP